jgi:hypothetical protein
MKAMLALLLLAGCSGVPTVTQSGSLTCVRVVTLLTTTTTVYVAELKGTMVVQPDCTIAVQHP